MAITLLRGRVLEEPEANNAKGMQTTVEKEDNVEEVARTLSKFFLDNPPILQPPLPFPQRLQKKKLDAQFAKFLKIIKKIQINIPFTNTLEQMPNYVKFMKEMLSKKKQTLIEECSVIIKKKLPQKVKDVESFIIPHTIFESCFDKVLYNLGANINLMPLFVFNKIRYQGSETN